MGAHALIPLLLGLFACAQGGYIPFCSTCAAYATFSKKFNAHGVGVYVGFTALFSFLPLTGLSFVVPEVKVVVRTPPKLLAEGAEILSARHEHDNHSEAERDLPASAFVIVVDSR